MGSRPRLPPRGVPHATARGMNEAELTVSRLGDVNEQVRARAIRALPTIAPSDLAAEAVGLAKNLNHADEDVREAAVVALGWCGDEVVNEYASGVVARLADTKLRVRDSAVRTLLQLRPGLRALHVPLVKDQYENGEWFARSAAAVILDSFAPEAAAVPSPVGAAAATGASSSGTMHIGALSSSRTLGHVAELASLTEWYEPDPYTGQGQGERRRALDSVKKQLFPVIEADEPVQLPFVVRMGNRLLRPSPANDDELPRAPKVIHSRTGSALPKAPPPQKAG